MVMLIIRIISLFYRVAVDQWDYRDQTAKTAKGYGRIPVY